MSQFQKDNLYEEALQMLYAYARIDDLVGKSFNGNKTVRVNLPKAQIKKTKALVTRMQLEV